MDFDRTKTLQQLAKEAMGVQDASNLRGVLLAWHRALCQDCVTRGGQVEEFLNILYLSKVSSLLKAETDAIGSCAIYDSGAGKDSKTDFTQAYNWARLEATK